MVARTDDRFIETSDEVTLSDIFSALRHRLRLVAAITLIVTFAGILYAILAQPTYEAFTVVMPSTGNGEALGKLGNGLAGAAAIAGLDLSSQDSQKDEYIAILKSRDLAQKFIEENGVLPALFPKRWDQSSKSWHPLGTGGMRATISRALASLSGDEGWHQKTDPIPTKSESLSKFDEIRDIKEDDASGAVTVYFEFRNPELSAQWANAYVALANDLIRQRTINEASKALNYLNQQIEHTSVSALRDTLYDLVEEQLKTIALANARQDYAFRIIDPAIVPEQRAWPKRAMTVIVAVMLGACLGMLSALVASSLQGDLIEHHRRTLV
jgi:uncharacterized protein involved in exopolysaccharide biosynthesis